MTRIITLVLFAAGCAVGTPDSGVVTSDDSGITDDTGNPWLPDDSGTAPVDNDGDGYDVSSDCDDNDPSVYPGAPEVCDGVDNNCDGASDEGGVCDGGSGNSGDEDDLYNACTLICSDTLQAAYGETVDFECGTDFIHGTDANEGVVQIWWSPGFYDAVLAEINVDASNLEVWAECGYEDVQFRLRPVHTQYMDGYDDRGWVYVDRGERL